MKKTVVILLSIALLLSLAGCHAVTPSGSSSSEAQSAFSFVNPFAMTATNGTPENHITYLHYSDYYFVSYMLKGSQMLSGDGRNQLDFFEEFADAPVAENLKKHYVIDMYEHGTTIPAVKKSLNIQL